MSEVDSVDETRAVWEMNRAHSLAQDVLPQLKINPATLPTDLSLDGTTQAVEQVTEIVKKTP